MDPALSLFWADREQTQKACPRLVGRLLRTSSSMLNNSNALFCVFFFVFCFLAFFTQFHSYIQIIRHVPSKLRLLQGPISKLPTKHERVFLELNPLTIPLATCTSGRQG